jgi:hypothetical protein
MITTCPSCKKKLKLSPKIGEIVKALSPGRSYRINCPQCAGAILLEASMLNPEVSSGKPSLPPLSPGKHIAPPPPPDLSGLSNSQLEGKAMVEDIPKALILMEDSPSRSRVIESIEALGYQAIFVQSAEEAMEKMQFVNYASVILHSRFEGAALEDGVFHKFMRDMRMNKRRYIFYILIGTEFSTLYDLQALANSANLVVNDQELPQLSLILRTAIPQYESMFAAIMSETQSVS